MTLKLKISLLVGLLSFAIAINIAHYTNNISTKELEKNAGESLVKLSKRVADILDREMLERYREIEFAASLSPLTNPNSTKEEKRAFLEKLKNKHKHHEWIGYALPDGTVEAGTNGYLEGKNVKARPWHPNGLKGGYIGDVHDALLLAKLLPNNSGEAIYFTDVAFPVKDSEGKVLGVLCTHLMWQWTRDVIRSIQKENSVDIFLLSNDGLILVGPNQNERKNIAELSFNVANEFKNKTSSYKLIDWKLGQNYLTAHTISNGFDEYKGFGWKVIVRQDVNSAFLDSKINSNKIILISLTISILAAIIGIVFDNKITSPLNKISENIKALKDGKRSDLTYTKAKDELGVLQNTLVELSETLNKETKLKDIALEKVDIALKVFDQSHEGILICNEHNQIILVNKAFTDITGYTQEEVFLKNPSILNSKKQSKEFYENMWNGILKNGKWEGSLINIKKDGSSYLEELRISTIKNDKGEITNYFAVFNSGF